MKNALFMIALLASGCGPGFEITLPDRFVELTESYGRGPYDLRATTPDGVVVGVDVIENREHGGLEFWKEAVMRRLRDQQGYALLSEEAVRSESGRDGHLMRFGRDLNGHAYRYTLAIFAAEDMNIYIVEAGGREEAFAPLETGIETSIRRMRF